MSAVLRGEWVVLCHTNEARLAVLAAAKVAGCTYQYASRATMRETIDDVDRRRGIDPAPRAVLQGTRAQMTAFYAAIPDDVGGIEGYEWRQL